MSAVNQENFGKYLVDLIASGHQLLQITTCEESRCLSDIRRALLDYDTRPDRPARRLVVWDYANGFSDSDKNKAPFNKHASNAVQALVTERFSSQYGPGADVEPFTSALSGTVTSIVNTNNRWYVIFDNNEKQRVVLDSGYSPTIKIGQKVKVNDPIGLVDTEDVVVVMLDPALFFNSEMEGLQARRVLRNLVEQQALSNTSFQRTLIFLGATSVKHPELDRSIVEIDYRLPSPEQLLGYVDYIGRGLPGNTGKPDAEMRTALANALRGFSYDEALNTLSYVARVFRGFVHEDPQVRNEMLRSIYQRKKDKWKKGGVIELIDISEIESFGEIGGYYNLKEWISRQKLRFSPVAKAKGVRPPKGMVLGGVQGTGKSLCGLVVARELNLPLLKLDVGSVFGSLLGESESRMRDALALIEANGPSVVFLDEADKALAGMADSQTDSGVGSRVLGSLLSWQAERQRESFLIMTLNRLDTLPPELFRTGRFDRCWYVGLPGAKERVEILEIHLRKNRQNLTLSATDKVAFQRYTRNATGSDIEQLVLDAVVETLYKSEGQSVEVTAETLLKLANVFKPSVSTTNTKFESVREMFGNAWPVSADTTDEVSEISSQRSVRIRDNNN